MKSSSNNNKKRNKGQNNRGNSAKKQKSQHISSTTNSLINHFENNNLASDKHLLQYASSTTQQLSASMMPPTPSSTTQRRGTKIPTIDPSIIKYERDNNNNKIRLGGGTFGDVWKSKDGSFPGGLTVAVKSLKNYNNRNDLQTIWKNLRKEAKAAAKCKPY